jgi:hypothetical protein
MGAGKTKAPSASRVGVSEGAGDVLVAATGEGDAFVGRAGGTVSVMEDSGVMVAAGVADPSSEVETIGEVG